MACYDQAEAVAWGAWVEEVLDAQQFDPEEEAYCLLLAREEMPIVPLEEVQQAEAANKMHSSLPKGVLGYRKD